MRSSDYVGFGLHATAATGSTAPSANGAAASGLFRELHGEVMRFIENGSSSAGAAGKPGAAALSPEGQWSQARVQQALAGGDESVNAEQQAFLQQVAPWAEEAGAKLGVAPDLLAAQAALESGWGQRPIRQADGSSSHNLFGIKAGASWRGEVAQALTTEYEQGQPLTRREGFRAYPDQAAAFRDFTQLLLDNPRYRGALQTGSDAQAYAQGLQRGGYASDPAYADKLQRVAARIQAGR
ncbi:flagellar assembly peptidoglycan hydrolase FlgJ [Roseateles violae]|uniref:Flagellar assembly peptidoglycan hydrolase FlgJ n=1 Tax=Roseateles violae TaxID=3058042 RepID=A0ABT8DWZ7_9BURK|nr:flagellar assembly peptidoglycan hydrolase FlgJ [Pelomonas sp. PFR6]MDN3921559.1 flagellar assembly peptidoglycan hydrolase FlgJ [Pelomonas sp. PFR6]